MTSTSAPAATPELQALAEAGARRRNFAIISHPDAGKTTLTRSCCSTGVRFSRPAP